jgi:hypothetical protein
MSFQNDDLLLVNRSGTSFKTEYGLLRERIIEGVGGATVSETEPTGEHEGDLWYQPSTDSLFVWVVTDTTGVVTSCTVRNGGSGYTSNVTNVETIGGDGEGLTLDIQAGVGGNYASPTVNQGGSGYAVGNVVFLIGAGNQNGSANVTAVNTVATGAWEPVGAEGGASVSVGDTAPADPEVGDLWFNSDDGRLYVFYEDTDSSQWVDASPDNAGNVELWERDGTTLSPANAGDNVHIGTAADADNIQLNADGSAEFAGNLSSSSFDSSSDAGVGYKLFSAGQIESQRAKTGQPNQVQPVFRGYQGSDDTSTINSDGSATFAGGVESDSYFEGTRINAIGGLNGYVWAGFETAGGPRTSHIRPDGTANFEGNVTAANVTFDAGTAYEVNVKDRILNLISRLDAIEANEQIDDATDTSLLQLVANASARLDSIEARLTALEGGN